MAALGDLSASVQNQERRWQLPQNNIWLFEVTSGTPRPRWKYACIQKNPSCYYFWEDIYIYIYIYTHTHTHTYSVHAMRQNHSDLSIGATQVWTCLKTEGVNPGIESWELRAMTGFVLELFFTWIWSNGINVIWTLKFQPEPRKSFAQFPCYLKSLSWKCLQF